MVNDHLDEADGATAVDRSGTEGTLNRGGMPLTEGAF